jgi:hypothetical protein
VNVVNNQFIFSQVVNRVKRNDARRKPKQRVGRGFDEVSVFEADAHVGERGEDGNIHRFAWYFGVQVLVAVPEKQRGYPFGRNKNVPHSAHTKQEQKYQT